MATERNRAARLVVWNRIRELRKFEIADLVSDNCSRYAAARFVKSLAALGYVELSEARENGTRGGDRWVLARDPGALLPALGRADLGRQKMWQSMRILVVFSVPDLISTAEVVPNTARKFTQALERFEYLTQARANVSGRKGSFAVWRLVKNTGPYAPVIRREGRGIYDPNLDKEIEIGE